MICSFFRQSSAYFSRVVVFPENIAPDTTCSFPPAAVELGGEDEAAWTVGAVEGAGTGLGLAAAAARVARIYAGDSEE